MSHRSFRLFCARHGVGVLAAGLLVLALSACESAETLETIRNRQTDGDFLSTVEPLREMLAEGLNDAEVAYLYGRALMSTGQPSLATWPLREAMRDPEWLMPAGVQLAYAGLVTNDFNEVVDVTTRILEAHPDHTLALLLRAQAQAHWRKDPEAALADAERVFELEPDVLEAYEPLIIALLALDRREDADEALAEAGQRLEAVGAPASNMAWHCSTTAILAHEEGDPQRSRKVWRECLDQYPSDPTVVRNAVEFYDAMGEWQASLDAIRHAFSIAPEQRMLRIALADRLRWSGEPAEGERLMLEATEAEAPQLAAQGWIDLGQFRNAAGEHAAAAEALERAIELFRRVQEPPPRLMFQYADLLLASGQIDRALEAAEDVVVPAQRRLIRARVLQERGDAEAAIEEFDEALRLWPNNASARYYAAIAAEQLGDFDRALEEYRYSIRISPAATDARTRAAKLLIAQNQPQLAYQLLFLDIAKSPIEPEGELLSMYLMARVANPMQIQSALLELGARDPARLPVALVHAANGVAEAAGPGAALNLLRDAPGLDYRDPNSAPVLRAIVRFAHAANEQEVSEGLVRAALAAHPEAAAFHEIHGLLLERSGAAPDFVRAGYSRAVQLDPHNAHALTGLGRLALLDDPTEALGYFDRAAAADPSSPTPKLAAARALLAIGRLEEAADRLNFLLDQHPFEAEAAAEVVSLDLSRDTISSRTLDRALRATGLGGGPAAHEQLSEVYNRLEQPEQAERAAATARRLREIYPPGLPHRG